MLVVYIVAQPCNGAFAGCVALGFGRECRGFVRSLAQGGIRRVSRGVVCGRSADLCGVVGVLFCREMRGVVAQVCKEVGRCVGDGLCGVGYVPASW